MILREKILLGLVGVAAVGAVASYLPAILNPPAGVSARTPIDFSSLTVKVQTSLKKGESTSREKDILAAATTNWLRNPFRDRLLVVEEREEPVVAAPTAEYIAPLPEYVGFLSIGDRLIAIIDGQDYRAGEPIDGGEFQLLRIFSDHIKVLRRGASDPVDVPLAKPFINGKPQELTADPDENEEDGSSSDSERPLVPGPPPLGQETLPPTQVPGVEVVPLPVLPPPVSPAPSPEQSPSSTETR